LLFGRPHIAQRRDAGALTEKYDDMAWPTLPVAPRIATSTSRLVDISFPLELACVNVNTTNATTGV
jgi:hypothetical protein